MSDAERRFTSVPVEIRGAADKRTIGGYAAKFNKLSQNLGGFVEQIDQRFFNKSRGDGWPDVMARYNHTDLIGTSQAGTLRLGVDEIGLTYEVDVPQARGDVYELVQRGDVRQSSFAFIAFEDEWTTHQEFNIPLRTLVSGRLIDVAPVDQPAYLDTSVGARALDGALTSLAKKFDASVDEVRSLSQAGDLSKFFKRTDNAGPSAEQVRRSAQAALAKATSLDPFASL
jgi:hypothetical protein